MWEIFLQFYKSSTLFHACVTSGDGVGAEVPRVDHGLHATFEAAASAPLYDFVLIEATATTRLCAQPHCAE